MKLNKDGRNMLVLSNLCDKTGRTILNSLKSVNLLIGSTSQN